MDDLVRNFAAAIFICAWFVWLFTALFSDTDASEIQRACGSAGVAQIMDTSFSPTISGSLTVVCRDGRVVRVK